MVCCDYPQKIFAEWMQFWWNKFLVADGNLYLWAILLFDWWKDLIYKAFSSSKLILEGDYTTQCQDSVSWRGFSVGSSWQEFSCCLFYCKLFLLVQIVLEDLFVLFLWLCLSTVLTQLWKDNLCRLPSATHLYNLRGTRIKKIWIVKKVTTAGWMTKHII